MPTTGKPDKFVHLFELDTISNQCGYPVLCPGDQPRFYELLAFPSKVSSLGIDNELRLLMTNCNEIFHKTGMPFFPCFFHHLCIPFSPICALDYFSKKRVSQLEEAVNAFNKEIARPKGVFVMWNRDFYNFLSRSAMKGDPYEPNNRMVRPTQDLKPGLEVWISNARRMEYCNEKGLSYSAITDIDSIEHYQPQKEQWTVKDQDQKVEPMDQIKVTGSEPDYLSILPPSYNESLKV